MNDYNPAFTPEERERVLNRTMASHPLEMFAFFRRWAPGHLRDILYTFIWNLGFAVFFVVLGMVITLRAPSPTAVWVTYLIANCVGFSIHAVFALTGCTIERSILGRGTVAVALYYMLVPMAGVVIGFQVASAILGRELLPRMGDPRWIIGVAAVSTVISAVLAVIYFWRVRSALAEAALEREQRRAADTEREALAANLRALQAQVEPHFLFNTLANVTSLIDADPARARHMLETFIRFLRASLAATRRSTTTLADEFALIGDFLEVLRIRMGDRLVVGIDLPPGLAALEIPPMLVQPAVENAIRHGLEPNVEGGRVDIRAHREADRLVLEVADTGVGFGDATTGGLGLANIRERLRLAHGDRARLTVRANSPRGTVVAIELPLAGP